MKRFIEAIAIAGIFIGLLSGCSDDKSGESGGDPYEDYEWLIPTTYPEYLTPKRVVINGESVEFTADVRDRLLAESVKPATNQLSVYVQRRGTLEDRLSGKGMTADAIDVHGPIDATDLEYLKKCVAEGELRSLDLSDADIEDNTIPEKMFFSPEYYYISGNYKVLSPPYLPLYRLVLPAELENIGYCAFANVLLTELDLPAGLKKISERSFSHNIFLGGELNVPESIEIIESLAFFESGDGTMSISIPGVVKEVFPSAFSNLCAASINIGEGVESIGGGAFGGIVSNDKSGLKVTFPNSLKSIDTGAFRGSNIAELNLPNSLKTIGPNAFRESNVVELTLPDGLIEIMECAFMDTPIETINLPASLTKVEVNAFAGLPGLKKVYSFVTNPDVFAPYGDFGEDYQTAFGNLENAGAAGSTPNDATVYVPDGCVNAYLQSVGWLWFDGNIRSM